jgi:hypothetical protein
LDALDASGGCVEEVGVWEETVEFGVYFLCALRQLGVGLSKAQRGLGFVESPTTARPATEAFDLASYAAAGATGHSGGAGGCGRQHQLGCWCRKVEGGDLFGYALLTQERCGLTVGGLGCFVCASDEVALPVV